MYGIEIKKNVDESFRKLSRKNPAQLKNIDKKIVEILSNPHKFKPLHRPMAGRRRVHFGSFVLVYRIDESRKVVVLENFDHHDRVYRN